MQTCALAPPRLLDEGRAVALELEGEVRRFHALWLRDNAPDPATRSPANGQRLLTLLDIPADTRIAEAQWQGPTLALRFEPEARQIGFDRAWLAAHAYDKAPPPAPGWTTSDIIRWDGAVAEQMPVESHAAITTDPATLRRWLANVRTHGFARLTGVPLAPDMLEKVVALFGYVRETNYGRVFDVRSEVDPSNLAYTNLGLQAHTDNPYRDPPPGLQILACIENDVEGGESRLVDGFEVARRLTPEDLALLTRHCARFDYRGGGVHLHSKRPIIETGCDGELLAIRFNNRSAAAFTDIPYDVMAAYYGACRNMAALVEDDALALRFRLEPGDLFIVDNLRILHGRTAFAGGGARWLQGCYADRDGLLSTLAMLEDRT